MTEPKNVNNHLSGILDKIRRDFETFNKTKVKIAILGKSGTGKSTFMNTLAGKKVSATNPIGECTGMNQHGEKEDQFEPKIYSADGVDFYDLPGYGTSNFPANNFLEYFKIKKNYDCILFMSSLRFNTESDLIIYSKLKQANIPCFVVWTKFDETLRRAPKDDPSLPEDPKKLAAEICKRVRNDLNNPNLDVFVISDDAHLFDFTRLKESIEENLSEIKKERFVESAAAQTEKDLRKKRKVADKLVAWTSALAGAASAIPDPTIVAGSALDITILYQMTQRILKIYGLDQSSIEYHSKAFKAQTAAEVMKRILNFASKEVLIQVLKRAGSKVAAKKITSYIPFVGQVVAAAIGFKIAAGYGKNVTDDAEAIAKEIIEDEISAAA